MSRPPWCGLTTRSTGPDGTDHLARVRQWRRAGQLGLLRLHPTQTPNVSRLTFSNASAEYGAKLANPMWAFSANAPDGSIPNRRRGPAAAVAEVPVGLDPAAARAGLTKVENIRPASDGRSGCH